MTAITPWTLRMPVPVEFGTGALERLPAFMPGLRRALIVTGRQAMKRAGVTARLESVLDAAGIAHAVFNGPRPITAATLPIIAISSTSGTGSHVGRVAVLSDRARGIKRALISDCLYPRAAICDPEILRTMPREVTACTGFDAFAQALEGFLSRSENPLGNLCAEEAMRIAFHTLPEVLERPDDLELRNRMAWADTLAGISLAANAIVIPHVIAMVLGGRYGIVHGRAIATVTVACLRHSRPGAVRKLSHVAGLLGCRDETGDDARADWAIRAVGDFIARIGMQKNVLEYGVPAAEFDAIGAEVRADFGVRVDADPVPTDAAGLATILRASVAW
jgi:alcohol dehydrogenase